MLVRKRRDRAFQFEFIERRQTPSTISIAQPFVHALAVNHANVPFHANVTASLIGMPSSGKDSGFMASAAGRASRLGAFTGLLNVSTPSNGGADVAFTLHGKHRSNMQITMTILGSGDNDAPVDLEGTFAITGGTGRVARATGGGRMTGVLDPQTLSMTLDLQGRFSP